MGWFSHVFLHMDHLYEDLNSKPMCVCVKSKTRGVQLPGADGRGPFSQCQSCRPYFTINALQFNAQFCFLACVIYFSIFLVILPVSIPLSLRCSLSGIVNDVNSNDAP